jgi:glucose-6-phosphate 1-epimerase
MKFSLALLAASFTVASGFVNQPKPALVDRSATALFDSRSRQKVEKRSKWLESRGMGGAEESGAATAVAAGGLMKNDEGLEYIKLTHPDTGASSEIYLLGGVVTSYKDADGTDFIAVRPDAKMDGSKPISGGLSHCFPQFGPGAIQQHGFARNLPGLSSRRPTPWSNLSWPFGLHQGMWDKEFLCTFSVNLRRTSFLPRCW